MIDLLPIHRPCSSVASRRNRARLDRQTKRHLSTSVLCFVLVAIPGLAAADGGEPARPARPAGSICFGLAVPEALFIHGHDVTIPLPALRVAWQVTPRISADFGAGYVPMEYESHAAIGHVGARWFASERPVAPYLLARVGIWDFNPTEGDRMKYRFALAGGGVEYTHSSGLSLWLELALGGVFYESGAGGKRTGVDLGSYGSTGIGYRLGR
jgi:hypothetical protein